jgi:hypothetical protein
MTGVYVGQILWWLSFVEQNIRPGQLTMNNWKKDIARRLR